MVILGGSDQGWIVEDKLTIDPKREEHLDIAKTLIDNEYANSSEMWMHEWYLL